MDAIIFILVFFALGFFAGETYTLYKLSKLLHKIAKSAGIDLESEIRQIKEEQEDVKPKVPRLIAETHNDMLYLFDKENDTFICQAKTMSELASIAKEQNKIIAAVVLHGNKVFAFHNGLSQEIVNIEIKA